jgi:uncharacterized membrane protein
VDLSKHPVVHGHPVHAILSDGPAVLVPLALAVELWDLARRKGGSPLSDTACASAAAAAASAGVVGWIDWLTIPGDHPARTPATIHGLINTAGIVAVLAAAGSRRLRLPLLTAATGGTLVAAWLGGDLVFRHGWRVRPAEEAEIVEKTLNDAGDELGRKAFADARREVADFERHRTFLPPDEDVP